MTDQKPSWSDIPEATKEDLIAVLLFNPRHPNTLTPFQISLRQVIIDNFSFEEIYLSNLVFRLSNVDLTFKIKINTFQIEIAY